MTVLPLAVFWVREQQASEKHLRRTWLGLSSCARAGWASLAPDGRAQALSSVSSWDFSVFHGAAFASRPGLPWVNSSFQSHWFIDLYRSVTLTGKEFILGNQMFYFILLSLSTVDAPFRIFTAPCFLCFVYIWSNHSQAVKIGIKKEEKLTQINWLRTRRKTNWALRDYFVV